MVVKIRSQNLELSQHSDDFWEWFYQSWFYDHQVSIFVVKSMPIKVEMHFCPSLTASKGRCHLCLGTWNSFPMGSRMKTITTGSGRSGRDFTFESTTLIIFTLLRSWKKQREKTPLGKNPWVFLEGAFNRSFVHTFWGHTKRHLFFRAGSRMLICNLERISILHQEFRTVPQMGGFPEPYIQLI